MVTRQLYFSISIHPPVFDNLLGLFHPYLYQFHSFYIMWIFEMRCYYINHSLSFLSENYFIHLGHMTHISISKLTIIGSDNGLLPGWHQAIIWTNARILLIGHLGTNLREIVIEVCIFSFKNAFENVVRKMGAISSRPLCIKPSFLSTVLIWI